jgi:hypothetical protein
MARSLQVTIEENREELKHRLEKQTTAMGKERLQMLYWLKLNIVNSRQELVKLLSKSEATITRWLGKYKTGGLAALSEVTRTRQSFFHTTGSRAKATTEVETTSRI